MSKGYTNIPDWMLDLDLDIYETIILAVIYGFSQDGDSVFKGSQNYLAKKAKCQRNKVVKALKKLVEMGLILKDDKNVNGVKLCEYRVYLSDTGCISRIQGCISGIHNNIVENKDIYKDNIVKKEIYKEKRFVKPTISEIADYIKSKGYELNAESFYYHYEANGWKVGRTSMKDWKAAVNTWEHRRNEERKGAPKKEESYVAQGMRQLAELKRKMGGGIDEQ